MVAARGRAGSRGSSRLEECRLKAAEQKARHSNNDAATQLEATTRRSSTRVSKPVVESAVSKQTDLQQSRIVRQNVGEGEGKISTRQPAKFLVKLVCMLRSEDPNTIRWEDSRLVLDNPKKLVDVVLVRYFHHSHYASFQRQLHFFGFFKVDGKGRFAPSVYENPFLKGHKVDAILKLKRRCRRRSLSEGSLVTPREVSRSPSPCRKPAHSAALTTGPSSRRRQRTVKKVVKSKVESKTEPERRKAPSSTVFASSTFNGRPSVVGSATVLRKVGPTVNAKSQLSQGVPVVSAPSTFGSSETWSQLAAGSYAQQYQYHNQHHPMQQQPLPQQQLNDGFFYTNAPQHPLLSTFPYSPPGIITPTNSVGSQSFGDDTDDDISLADAADYYLSSDPSSSENDMEEAPYAQYLSSPLVEFPEFPFLFTSL